MVGDGDAGQDKMEVGAKREGVSPSAIAERYTALFMNDLSELAIPIEDIQFPRATEYIREQIALAKTLEEKGFAYRLPDGLYFDTQKFPGYGKLGNIEHVALKDGARIAVLEGKHHPADFALWRLAKPHDLQQWDSPWGRGNPGWHIECSAMIRALLGQEIDIHTGGEDHIAVHHNNEIAQSEAASGRTFVHYWMHFAFLTIQGEKISKSLKNEIYLSDIATKGFHPLALRYFFLQAHYRTPLAYSWDALAAAASALERLWALSRSLKEESGGKSARSEVRDRFLAAVRDDLGTPQALGILWEALRSEEYAPDEKWGLIEDADAHLGLSLITPPVTANSLSSIPHQDIPSEVQDMLEQRERAREAKEFGVADQIRRDIAIRGYHVDDGPNGPVLTRGTL
jgi:cysteinyl-tRNA synthetase